MVNLTVPTRPAGLYFVPVLSATSVVALTGFYIVTASMTLDPTIGRPGQVINVTGSGFFPSAAFDLCFSSNSSSCNGPDWKAVSDSSGNLLPMQIQVPAAAAGTYYVLIAAGPGLWTVASATFTVL